MGDNSNVKIDITANADGVKPGVAAAEKELGKLEQSTSQLDKKYIEASASSEKLSGATARTTQQFATLGKEIATGETGRIPGTLARIATGFGPIGIGVAAVTAAVAAGVWAWNEWGSSAGDAAKSAADELKQAEKEVRDSKHLTLQEEMQATEWRIQSIRGELSWTNIRIAKQVELRMANRANAAEYIAEESRLAELRGKQGELLKNETNNLARMAEQLAKNTKESKKLTDAERERKRLQEKDDRESERLNLQADAMGELAARWNYLNGLLKTGQISAEAMAYELEHAGKKGKAAAEESSKAWETFADNTQRTLSDVLYDGMNGKFNSVEEAFKQMLFRMAANAAAANLTEAMFGNNGNSGGDSNGWIGSIINWFASANGNAFGDGGVYAFANGGAFSNQLVDKPTPFKFANGGGFSLGVMGEEGPEAVMPLARGSDGKLGIRATGGDGGGAQVITDNSVYHIDASADRALLLADFNRLSDAKFAKWTEQMRRQRAIA